MRGSSFVMGSALLLAGGLNLLWAQHGGGGHSSSGHSSGGQASASHSSFSSGSRFHPVGTGSIYPTHPAPIGLQPGFTGYPGINRGALNGGYGRGGYGLGRGFRGGYYYLPYYFGDYGYGYGYDNSPCAYNQAPQDYGDQTAGVTANLLGDQVAQLSSEVEALQNERAVPYAAAVPMRPLYKATSAMVEDDTPSVPPLTLVLHDGKQIQLKSYAVMGQNIWDFSAQPAKRFALSNVDLSASRSATEADGGEFPEIH